VTPLGSGAAGVWDGEASRLNQDLQDFEDFLALGLGLDGARSSLVLNQDLQDFQDFLALGLSLDDARSSLVLNQDLQNFQD
jgi:hypothetical protein